MEDRTMTITPDIQYIGVNDHDIDLFEGQYGVPYGMAYNSYVIFDEKIAVLDTVDKHFTEEWMGNLKQALDGKKPDYLIIHHMECDHTGSVAAFVKEYPETTLVATAKAFTMLQRFHPEFTHTDDQKIAVKEGDKLSLGKHELTFIMAPMVHWPEVMFSYDACDKVLFSADAFGSFGANDLMPQDDDEEDGVKFPEKYCLREARRYYIGIVGKYGPQVQAVLKKAANLDIEMICALHGCIKKGDLSEYLEDYDIWSSYGVDDEGVLICYTTVYNHTEKAAFKLKEKLEAKGQEVRIYDLARCEMSEAVADAFNYGKVVLATTTYNADIFPFMKTYIDWLKERNFQNRKIGFIENGSWAPAAARIMKGLLDGTKNTFCENVVTLPSIMTAESEAQMDALVDELLAD